MENRSASSTKPSSARSATVNRRGEHVQAAGAVVADQVDHRPAVYPNFAAAWAWGQAVDEEHAECFVAAVVDLVRGGEEVRTQRWSWLRDSSQDLVVIRL